MSCSVDAQGASVMRRGRQRRCTTCKHEKYATAGTFCILLQGRVQTVTLSLMRLITYAGVVFLGSWIGYLYGTRHGQALIAWLTRPHPLGIKRETWVPAVVPSSVGRKCIAYTQHIVVLLAYSAGLYRRHTTAAQQLAGCRAPHDLACQNSW
jgi:hypothetical protein